jgi:hypothetical protein
MPASIQTLNGKARLVIPSRGGIAAIGGSQVPSAFGEDGREVQLQKSATHIQWRYEGEANWTNLVALSELEGEPGAQGDPGPMPYTYRGAWSGATAYTLYDAVTHQGSLYWLPATGGWTIGGAPPAYNWELLVSKGDTGEQGETGKSAYQSYLDTTADDPVLTEEQWSEGGGGGGDYLPLAGGTMDANAEISFTNFARFRQNPGGNGLDLICSNDYIHRWMNGSLYIWNQNDAGIRVVMYGGPNDPGQSLDITEGYLVGSRFIKDDGTTFECTDNTDGAAVWDNVTPIPISTPGIAHVHSGGNDTTGAIGDPSLPYLTAQAAWDDGARKLKLGAGSYSISHTSTSGTTPEEFVFVQGIGKEFSSLSITWGAPDGTPGTSSGAFQQAGGNGEQPSKLNLQSDSTVALSLSLSSGDGGDGGNGDAGTSEVPGGNGSDGGTGGSSSEFELSYCFLSSFSCVAGLGGERGTGGIDGGAGAGSDGVDGAAGTITGGRFEWCDVSSAYAPDSQDIFYASTVEGVGRLVVDGNKGDITVGGGGDSWSINSNCVTLSDLVSASTKGKIIGRKTAGSGNFEECDISDFIQVAATASNITDTIGTLADVAGMSFSIASNEKVVAIFRGFWATSVSGSGFKYSFTGPGSPTDVQIGDFSFTSATALRTESGMTAFSTTATQGGGTLLNTAMPITIQIYVRNGGTPGTVQLRMGGEVNGSTFTLYKGFTMQVLRIP